MNLKTRLPLTVVLLINAALMAQDGTTLTGTVVDAKLIFRKAMEGLACSLILCHNHPSGNLHPSQADIDLTAKGAGQDDFLKVIRF